MRASRSPHDLGRDFCRAVLACALRAHPAESLLLSDPLRLPELFAFDVASLRAPHLIQSGWFEINREGGWDMVRLRESAGEE